MKFSSFRNQKGFSLVELMIVVGIIGILSTLAMPRFKQFQAKAKMGEAKGLLAYMFTLQQTYALDNNTYLAVTALGANTTTASGTNACVPAPGSGAETIGFRIEPCQDGAPIPRYAYSVPTATASTFIAQAVTGAATANRVCPGNAAHHYAINQTNVLYGGTGAAAVAIGAGTTAAEPSAGVVCKD